MLQHGPSQRQLESWLKEVRQLQKQLHHNDILNSRVYIKQLTNVMEDLLESFQTPPEPTTQYVPPAVDPELAKEKVVKVDQPIDNQAVLDYATFISLFGNAPWHTPIVGLL